MKLWMSAETYRDVGDACRTVSRQIENTFNQSFSKKSYGRGVKEWAFIPIILPEKIDGYKVEGYTEYRRYPKDDKSIEFRLRIDYVAFRDGDKSSQTKLICEGLIRSLERLDKNPIPDFNHLVLKEDFVRFCENQNWL